MSQNDVKITIPKVLVPYDPAMENSDLEVLRVLISEYNDLDHPRMNLPEKSKRNLLVIIMTTLKCLMAEWPGIAPPWLGALALNVRRQLALCEQ